MRIAAIVPVYEHFDYAELSVQSFLAHTPDGYAIVIDDASPSWGIGSAFASFNAMATRLAEQVAVVRFAENGGLTRSWNCGLAACRSINEVRKSEHIRYAVCTNSDVLFTPGWHLPLTHALERGFALVGPITNAPGSEKVQDVERYYVSKHRVLYRLTDDPIYLSAVAERLRLGYGDEVRENKINGFCMMAKVSTWWANAFDAQHVFKPRNDFNSKEQRNPTPLMTLNEYELQGRWRKAGLRVGFCPGSMVFHYRAVSRGNRYRQGKWFRRAKSK